MQKSEETQSYSDLIFVENIQKGHSVIEIEHLSERADTTSQQELPRQHSHRKIEARGSFQFVGISDRPKLIS